MPSRTRRALRYIRSWWWYWTRMSLTGIACGILIGGLYNATPGTQFDHPHRQATHAAP